MSDQTFEDLIEERVAAGVEAALRPYLRRLADPECLTYTAPQAAVVLGTSATTVRRLVDQGVLPVVPHMGDRRLIPRAAVEALVANETTAPAQIRRAS
jgi:excisionase family DNA binding protein